MKPITDLSIQAIEVTQAVQYINVSSGYGLSDNALPLNGDRDVAIRVYVGHDGEFPGTDPLDPVLKGAEVTIRWAATHYATPGAVLPEERKSVFDVPSTTNIDILRDDHRGSATFVIPAKLLGKQGTSRSLWVQAEIHGPAGFVDTKPANDTLSIEVGGTDEKGVKRPGGLVVMPKVKVRAMLIHYWPDGSGKISLSNPDFVKPAGWPSRDLAWAAGMPGSLMTRLFPMQIDYAVDLAWLEYGPSEVNWMEDYYEFERSLFDKLNWAFGLLVPQPDYLVGWLPASAGKGLGKKGAQAQSVAWMFQQGDAYEGMHVLAHEVGHLLGLPDLEFTNCPESIRETGFDLLFSRPVPATTCDIMGKQPGWVSPWAWGQLTGAPCPCAGVADNLTVTEWAEVWINALNYKRVLRRRKTGALLVSGALARRGNEGRLRSFRRLDSHGPWAIPNDRGKYSLAFYDRRGRLLARHPFDLRSRMMCGDEGDDVYFSFLLRWPAATTRVTLEHGKVVLDERHAFHRRPHVQLELPEKGSRCDRVVDVAWNADSDQDASLRYTLVFSHNGGKSWSPIAIDLQDTQLQLDAGALNVGERCRVRVIASDGFSSTQHQSEAFEVVSTERDAAHGA